MRNFIKTSLKTTVSYGAGVFLFTFFLIAPISMESNRNTWIAVYSLIFFTFTLIYLYKQMWKAGASEKRELGDKHGNHLKGLLYGLVGFAPFLLIEILYFLIYPHVDGITASNIIHGIFRCAFGPMYFLIRLMDYTWYSYLISSLIIPICSFIGFAAGFKGKGIKDIFTAFGKDEEDFLS